jgi:hypothetical protein
MSPELWNVIIGIVSLILGYLLKGRIPAIPQPQPQPNPTPTNPEFPLLELLWNLLRDKYPNLPPFNPK